MPSVKLIDYKHKTPDEKIELCKAAQINFCNRAGKPEQMSWREEIALIDKIIFNEQWRGLEAATIFDEFTCDYTPPEGVDIFKNKILRRVELKKLKLTASISSAEHHVKSHILSAQSCIPSQLSQKVAQLLNIDNESVTLFSYEIECKLLEYLEATCGKFIIPTSAQMKKRLQRIGQKASDLIKELEHTDTTTMEYLADRMGDEKIFFQKAHEIRLNPEQTLKYADFHSFIEKNRKDHGFTIPFEQFVQTLEALTVGTEIAVSTAPKSKTGVDNNLDKNLRDECYEIFFNYQPNDNILIDSRGELSIQVHDAFYAIFNAFDIPCDEGDAMSPSGRTSTEEIKKRHKNLLKNSFSNQ